MKALKQLRDGVVSLGYWWLKGYPPVGLNSASERTTVCLRCPKNQPATMFEAPKRGAVNAIRAAMAVKHHLKLVLPEEALLGICEPCGCDLRLKVWQPPESIFFDGKPDYFDELWEQCWVRKEAPASAPAKP